MRGRSRSAPSLPPFINGKPETLARPGLGRVVEAGGGAGGGGREIDFLGRADGLWPPPLRAHPWPSAGELSPWAVYGGDRAEPGSGARELGCGMAAARVRPEPRAPSSVLSLMSSGTPRPGVRAWVWRVVAPAQSRSPRKGAVIGRPGLCRKPSPFGPRSRVLEVHFHFPLGSYLGTVEE